MASYKKYIYYSLILYFFFALFLSANGYFKIGLLSDDYYNFHDAVNTTLYQKFTGNLPFTSNLHLRPIYYISLQLSSIIHDNLGYSYDNFIYYRFQNLILYFILVFTAGLIVLKNTFRTDLSLFASSLILVYPNNIHNICWTAGRVDIMVTIFALLSIYFAYDYVFNKSIINLTTSLLFFIFALLSKETAVILPFVILFFLYNEYGSVIFKRRSLIFIHFIILAIYFLLKLFLQQAIFPVISFSSIIGTFLKAVSSLFLPFDYLSLLYSFSEINITVFLYVVLMVIIIFILYTKFKKYKYALFLSALLFVLLILPNIYAGYFRPQLVLFPFTVVTIFIACRVLYSYYLNSIFRQLPVYIAIFTLIFWIFTSGQIVRGWETSYELARKSMDVALGVPFDFSRKNIVIGQPGRIKQCFMFDKITAPYNYYRYYKFEVKDSLYDMVLLGALNSEDINVPLTFKRINSDEFNVQVNNDKQFFYIEGVSDRIFSQGILSNGVFVKADDHNAFGKVNKIKIKKISGDIICYIYLKDNYLKIF